MKRIAAAVAIIAALAGCKQTHRSEIQRKVDAYQTVTIETPDLSHISDNGKEVLNLYRFAADETDRIYWKQYFGDKSLMDAIDDPATRVYAMINYGPWDRLDGRPFVPGYGERPEGVNFYPADMTDAEFMAFDDPDKFSPYTLIRRDATGNLKTVWYHDEYKENIEKICNYLQAAADITIVPSVREYLLKKIEGLKTDDYYESSIAWLDMTDSKMDLVLGPNENADDQRFGLKRSYGAFVLLKDLNKTAEMSKFIDMLPQLQNDLPCPDECKQFQPGLGSTLFACNALYYAGHENAGIKVIAINLPYDSEVQTEKGTRTILLKNILEQKFNHVIYPSGIVLLDKDEHVNLDQDAFFWNIAFREVAHGLGVKETINGRGPVETALGNKALTWEEAKGNVIGTYLSYNLIKNHNISSIITKESAIATFIVSLIRSERFGEGEALGRANIMVYNYLNEHGAFRRQASGKYEIDYDKAYECISELAGLILKVQATGDYKYASDFEQKYAVASENYKADLVNLRLENIPVDIRFEFSR